jgi:hypothetical protein
VGNSTVLAQYIQHTMDHIEIEVSSFQLQVRIEAGTGVYLQISLGSQLQSLAPSIKQYRCVYGYMSFPYPVALNSDLPLWTFQKTFVTANQICCHIAMTSFGQQLQSASSEVLQQTTGILTSLHRRWFMALSF